MQTTTIQFMGGARTRPPGRPVSQVFPQRSSVEQRGLDGILDEIMGHTSVMFNLRTCGNVSIVNYTTRTKDTTVYTS